MLTGITSRVSPDYVKPEAQPIKSPPIQRMRDIRALADNILDAECALVESAEVLGYTAEYATECKNTQPTRERICNLSQANMVIAIDNVIAAAKTLDDLRNPNGCNNRICWYNIDGKCTDMNIRHHHNMTPAEQKERGKTGT